jgi:serine/threonine protein kinase
LHAAHELKYTNGEPCGVVHRDVSPQNILVAAEGSAKLIDFGAAKTRLRVAAESTPGEIHGRFDFMAPEQARAEPIDRRADIWSVGATLFHLLSGHGPFGGGGSAESRRLLLAGASPLPPPPDAHPAVVRILSGCLALRREDRFPTAEQLGWAIDQAIERMGVAATAGDLAEFLADSDACDHSWLSSTGRCAIPEDLTSLRIDTARLNVPKRSAAVAARSTLRLSLAALACGATIGGLAAAVRVFDAPPPPALSAAAASTDEGATHEETGLPAAPAAGLTRLVHPAAEALLPEHEQSPEVPGQDGRDVTGSLP